jgi:hypothetical protein
MRCHYDRCSHLGDLVPGVCRLLNRHIHSSVALVKESRCTFKLIDELFFWYEAR